MYRFNEFHNRKSRADIMRNTNLSFRRVLKHLIEDLEDDLIDEIFIKTSIDFINITRDNGIHIQDEYFNISTNGIYSSEIRYNDIKEIRAIQK